MVGLSKKEGSPAKPDECLALLYDVGKKVGAASEVSELLDEIMRMTIKTLRAVASSVLLVDQNRGDLYFEVAEGKVETSLRQVRLSLNSGIAGWVARNARPTIVNDVAGDKRFNKGIDKTTGFVTKSVLAVPMVWEHRVIGVLEVLNKADGSGFNKQDLEVLQALASTAAAVISNARLQQAVITGYSSTIKALVAAIDAKDPYTRGHSQRVMQYALLGSNAFPLSVEELQTIEFGALLHDIGKIGIDDAILRKSDCLTQEEWFVVHKHPQIGANIIGEVAFLKKTKDIILYHHERYDGTGYPAGLKGENIPLGARLVAVADTLDTMTSDRPYRAALETGEAMAKIGELVGTQLCPRAVKALTSALKTRQLEIPVGSYQQVQALSAVNR
ncbi:MAG: HD domain-containing phosphohydrolase [Dehalococcoidales bacterium]|nr:HD domain-containing phosphohydrolase [Dehalococcoidales bacterium]